MNLVAVSGSTVCDWVLYDDQKNDVEFCSTPGFNPFFHNEVLIFKTIERTPELMRHADEVKNIFFYGTGCTSNERNGTVRRGLTYIFRHAHIHVSSDLTGVARAFYSGKACMIAMLGTGSSSCYVDPTGNIIEKTPSLGHFLGDEGSGAYFGRELLTLYMYNRLPKDIHKLLTERHGLDSEVIFRNVYAMPYSNVYLSSFMQTLSSMKDHEFVKEFIYNGLSRFITYHIWSYKEYKYVPTHFIGSIGHFFEQLLEETCDKHRLKLGRVVRRPIREVADYHKKLEN